MNPDNTQQPQTPGSDVQPNNPAPTFQPVESQQPFQPLPPVQQPTDSVPAQPLVVAPGVTPTPATYVEPGEVPGRVLGIVGFVFFFVSLALPGLIMCIVALKQSTKAGYKNTLAKAGIWLNAIGVFLGVALIALIALGAVQSLKQETTNAEKADQQAQQASQQEEEQEQQQSESTTGAGPTDSSSFGN